MIRLGVHAQSGDRIREMEPGLVHWVDAASFDLMAFVRGLGGLNLARRWVDEGALWRQITENPEAAAWWYWSQWWERFQHCKTFIDYVVGGNEIFGSDKPLPWQMDRVHKFEMEMMRHCHLNGLKYASDSWPTGNIEPEQWAYLSVLCERDGVRWHGDAISLHEYWRSPAGPLTPEGGLDYYHPNLIGRFFHYKPLPPVPIIITECGYDNYKGADAKRGWSLDYTMPERDAVYASHLEQYADLIDALAAKSQVTVIGATVFTSGRNSEWVRKGFDITGIWQIEAKIRDRPKEHTVYAPIPVTSPSPSVSPSKEEVLVNYRSFWQSPFDDPVSLEEVANLAKSQTPEGMTPAIIWPTMYGTVWQKNLKTALGDLAPGSVSDLFSIRAQLEDLGCGFGGYVVPRDLTAEEGQLHQQVGLACGFLAVDVEPYEYFLTDPAKDPDEYLQALWEGITTEFRMALSIVPQPSGLAPIGDASLTKWLLGSNEVRPQCYWTDNPDLHPESAIPYLELKMQMLGQFLDTMPIIPIVPSPGVDAEVTEYLAEYGERDLDIWRILVALPSEEEPEGPSASPSEEPIDWEAEVAAMNAKVAAMNAKIAELELRIQVAKGYMVQLKDLLAVIQRRLEQTEEGLNG